MSELPPASGLGAAGALVLESPPSASSIMAWSGSHLTLGPNIAEMAMIADKIKAAMAVFCLDDTPGV